MTSTDRTQWLQRSAVDLDAAAACARLGRAALAAALVLVAGVWVDSAPAQDELQVILTAKDPDAVVQFGDDPNARVGQSTVLYYDEQYPDDVVEFGVGDSGGPTGMALSASAAQFAMLLQNSNAALKLRADGGITVVLTDGVPAGSWIDLYQDRAGPAVLVDLPGAGIALGRGSLRIAGLADGGIEVLVGSGQAVAGAGDAADAGTALGAAGSNAVAVSADGTTGAPRRVEGVAGAMGSDRAALVQRSLLPRLVGAAEAVAEGDIEPPTRGTRIPAVAAAPTVRISEIVPRGSVVFTPVAGTTTSQSLVVRTQGEEFVLLGRQGVGNAAFVVVGGRLLRTRIIGNPGTGSPISANNLSRPVFSLRGGN